MISYMKLKAMVEIRRTAAALWAAGELLVVGIHPDDFMRLDWVARAADSPLWVLHIRLD